MKVQNRYGIIFLLMLMIMVFGCSSCVENDKKNDSEINSVEKLTSSDICEKYGLNLNEKTIAIPGVQNEYHFIYISDTHCSIKTTEMIETWNTTSDDRIKLFSNEKGLSSAEQFPGWIQLANDLNVDALLMGGDIIDYLTEENVNYISQNLEELKMSYLYTMGNHDSYDVFESKFISDSPLLERFFINGDYECQVIDYDEFYICSVNDFGSSARAEVSEKALEEFSEIYDVGKPIVLICHVPLCSDNTLSLKEDVETLRGGVRLLGRNVGEYEYDETSLEFYDMVLADDSPVEAILSGHVHFYHEDMLNDSIVQFVSDTSSDGNGILLTICGEDD